MKFKFLSALIFFISYSAFAQQQRFILPLGEELLLAKASGSIDKTNSGFEIIDLTGDSVLGYMPTVDASNDRVAIYAPLPKQEWLATLLGAASINSSLSTGISFLLVVSDLSVGGTDKSSYAGMKGRLYASLAGKEAYSLIKPIDEFYVNVAAGLKESSNNMINLFRSVLAVSLLSPIVNQKDAKDKAGVIKEEQAKFSFISNGVFPSGIYMSYQELKSFAPAFSQFFVKVDTLNKKVQVNSFTISDSTLHPVDGAYAVAVGNDVYLYKNKQLYPLESKGNNLFFSKYVDPVNRKNNANFWRDNVGARFIESYNRNPFDNKHTLQINNYRDKGINGEAIKINAETGSVEL